MNLEKVNIINKQGETVLAQAPIIISASRSTDIPAFYGDWFIESLNNGYIKWKNPFNGLYLYVSFSNTRFIVFWSKNYAPFLKNIKTINEKNINSYYQFTINDYEKEKYEQGIPNLQFRIDTFKKIVDFTKNPDKVIWRFDPLLLTDKITIDQFLEKINNIGNQLKGYTNKLVISFADINNYKKVANNLKRENINYKEWNERTMIEFATGLQELNKQWNFEIGTCAERIDLKKYDIIANKCIDDELIAKLSFPQDSFLLKYLGYTAYKTQSGETRIVSTKNNKDKGQREFCGCIVSKDIGEYNTCPHECVYCYANSSYEIAKANYKTHKENPLGETITGK